MKCCPTHSLLAADNVCVCVCVCFALQEDAWVTNSGADPLPTTEENVTPLEEPTQEEIDGAFQSIHTIMLAMRVASVFKRKMVERRSRSGSDSRPATATLTPSGAESSSPLLMASSGPRERSGSVTSDMARPLPPPASPKYIVSSSSGEGGGGSGGGGGFFSASPPSRSSTLQTNVSSSAGYSTALDDVDDVDVGQVSF
jgi:hypothetical protein